MRKHFMDDLLEAMNSKKKDAEQKIGTVGADGKVTYSADDLEAIAKAIQANTKRNVAKRTLAEERKDWFRDAVGAKEDDKISMSSMIAGLWLYAMEHKADFASWYKEQQNAADSTVQENDSL